MGVGAQAGIGYEFPLTRKVGGRVATVAFFSPDEYADKAINGMWEAFGVHAGITCGH